MTRKISGLQQLGREDAGPEIAGRGRARARAEPACRHGLCGALHAPEFTCLCPITGQPDFAHFVVDYAPAAGS